MSLTQMQYDEIMRDYERRREQSRHKAGEAVEEVRSKIPGYKELEKRIADVAMECARAVIDSGDKDSVSSMKAKMEALADEQKKLLTDNGYPEDYLDEKYVCPDCKDTGYINGTKMCHCLRHTIIRYTYRQSNIEEVLKRENFDTLSYDYYTDSEREKMVPVIEECKRFASDFGKDSGNILLYGNVGVGKTFLTNCMAKAILDKGYSVIYFTSMRLFDTLSHEMFQYGENGSLNTLNDIFTCDLLIIDDLGTEGVNSFVAGRLFDIINERDLRRRSTIISTNLTFEDLVGRYTERNFSRIFGKYTILHPDVDDIRIKKRRS